ncbi:MAG: radical SAM protein [Bacteroidales bacterium]|nr:radical SAM protein [Bacteroidales bacterium]
MAKIERELLAELKKHRTSNKFLCNAPFLSMNITTLGTVTPCCFNTYWDNYPSHSINEIWNGDVYNSYRTAIKRNELPEACALCEKEIRNKEFNSVKIHQFDDLKVSRLFKNKIRKLDLLLSNVCNLECIMCNGNSSSRIRENREHLPPLKNLYGQDFRNEIKPLLWDMQEIVFLGGEPFLNSLYYDIWEDMIAINPKCKISVVTNGTILNDRIKSLLERGNFKINLSFDAIIKETYEAIRINAKFEETMANMKYFGDTLARQGKRLNIPICPLKINRFEIPDLIRFCNGNGYSINICEMNEAFNISMDYMSSNELKETKDFYLSQKFHAKDENTKTNIANFNDLIRRIDQWIERRIESENYIENFDLGKDKMEEYKKILFKKMITGLKSIGYNEEEANALGTATQKRIDNTLSAMPDYFNSNHLYKKMATFPSNILALYAAGKEQTMSDESRITDIFFYK